MGLGLADDLGYSHHTGNRAHRAVRWFAGTRPGGWFFSRTLRHLDTVIARLTHGRRIRVFVLDGAAPEM